MLEAMRQKAGSWVVKGLMVILIGSFGVWGIGDIFRRVTTPDTHVAEVGGVKITPQQLNVQFRRDLARLRSMLGVEVDPEQARELGIMQRSLDQIIDGQLLALEANRLGIIVDEDELRAQIAQEPAFRNPLGQFDPRVYELMLNSNGLTEATYIASLREQILRGRITGPLGAGAGAPAPLTNAIYAYRHEKRVAELVRVPREGAGEAPQPDDAALADFHQKHPDLFSAPEQRDVTIVYIDPNDIAADIKPTDERIEEEFERRKSQLAQPEKRNILQLVARDEATAQKAYEAVKAGTSFADAARDITKQSAETLDLGAVTRSDLTPDLGKAAFAIAEGGVSQPFRSALGWHIVKVEKIEPAQTPTLAAMRDEMAREAARELAADEAIRIANRFEDRLAGGADVEAAAQAVNAKIVKVAGLTRDGAAKAGQPPDALAKDVRFLQLAFNAGQGTQSSLTESSDGGYYVVRVDAITPRTLRPLAEVTKEVAQAWRRERLDELARKKAETLLEKVRAGTPLKDAASAIGLKSETSLPFTRIAFGAQSPIPQGLTPALFKLKPGGADMAPNQDGYAVGQLVEIQPADPAADKAGADEVGQEIRVSIAGDIIAEFTTALRARFPVSVNTRAIDDASEGRDVGQAPPRQR